MSGLTIELVALDSLRQAEEHSVELAERLADEIGMAGVWTHPVVVDRASMGVMDGHHRIAAARRLGLCLIPTIFLSYDDSFVHIKAWRPDEEYSAIEIRRMVQAGQVLPMKTTRHIFDVPLPSCRAPLDLLNDSSAAGYKVNPAAAHPSRIQILAPYYHALGRRLPMRTLSASALDVETPETIVPHPQMRQQMMRDPCLASLIAAAPCRISLGRGDDGPFRLERGNLLLLPPALLADDKALSAAVRWGIEAAFIRAAYPFDQTRLPGLLRHGAELLRALPARACAQVEAFIPTQIAAELLGSDLHHPSNELIQWLASIVGLDVVDDSAAGSTALELELPIERVLISNGDSRLLVDPISGKNKYGTVPRPRPEAVHFSSSTASTISDYGFLYADVLRRDLLAHLHETNDDARDVHSRLSDAIICELADLFGLEADAVDGAIAPSGTDTEFLALLIARAGDPDATLTNILIAPEETGRGVKLAGAGLHFDSLAATGAPIQKGQPAWPDARIEVVSLPLRNEHGIPLKSAELDALFLKEGREALARGHRVLAHKLIGSKTGLSAPSDSTILALCAEAPDRVDVVVDACQMRLDFRSIGDMLRRGWMVQVSGSKALTGPPFSGALLIPTGLRSRRETAAGLLTPGIGYAEDWSSAWSRALPATKGPISFGAAFRWLPALLEVQLWRQVPPILCSRILTRFSDEIAARLQGRDCFRPLETGGEAEGEGEMAFTRRSIVAFEVLARGWSGKRVALGPDDCRQLFEMLNRDLSEQLPDLPVGQLALLRQEIHIGQPVELGDGERLLTVLRLVLGFRFFTIVGLAGPGSINAALESEISDLVRAIDKLEILAENWWRLSSLKT